MDVHQIAQQLEMNDEDIRECLADLAIEAHEEFTQTGNKEQLDRAVKLAKGSIDTKDGGILASIDRLNTLAFMLARRYERTGEMADLEEAITVAKQAVDSIPADHADRAGYLSNLGNNLEQRFERTGELTDLDGAITVARQAVDSTSCVHPHRAACLSNLGNKLRWRYERTGDIADLEEGITVARQAVDSTPVDHPDRAGMLNNLGNNLQGRYERTGEMADLEEAITVAMQAVDSTPANHVDWAGWLINLGNKLHQLSERTGEMTDLEDAITVARQAVDSTPCDHPDRAACLSSLGNKLGSRYEWTGEMADLEEASSHLQAAWSCEAGIPFHRVQAAAICLSLLTMQSKIDVAIRLGQAVLDLLPVVNTNLLDHSDQQFVMSTFAGVAANVCACFLATDQAAGALESLERGRAVILGQLVDGRGDLSSLRQDRYDIACRYERLRDKVNETPSNREQGTGRAQAANRRREAMAELNECVEEIRRFTGHERFLLGQTLAEMQECALGGTIVVVNITDFRSDAILISKTAIRTLCLSRLLASDARAWLGKKWTGREVRRKDRPRKNKEYLGYLEWLWNVCVKLVLDEVYKDHEADDLSRIWWIGTGLGSSMPFHAAGVHSPGSTENAFSKAVSSYTPSIKTLGYARGRDRITESMQVSLLIATMPTTPADALSPDAGKLCDLPGVMKEEKHLTELVAGNIPVQSLNSPSVAQVIDKMRDCSIAHFACHGLTDHADPSNSGLILQRQDDQGLKQDRLTVRRVSELNLADARIAYLSACSTAENKAARLSDEVIHVVSGFQVAGFPHVVGCLWPSIDRVCVEVAGGFYQSLFKRRRDATCWGAQAVACAVREAVMAVREADMDAPLVWAQFVHFGA